MIKGCKLDEHIKSKFGILQPWDDFMAHEVISDNKILTFGFNFTVEKNSLLKKDEFKQNLKKKILLHVFIDNDN